MRRDFYHSLEYDKLAFTKVREYDGAVRFEFLWR